MLFLGLDFLFAGVWCLVALPGYLLKCLFAAVKVVCRLLGLLRVVLLRLLRRREEVCAIVLYGGDVRCRHDERLELRLFFVRQPDGCGVYLCGVLGDEVIVRLAVAYGHIGELFEFGLLVKLHHLHLQRVVRVGCAVVLVDDVESLHAAVSVNEVARGSVPHDAAEVAVGLDVRHLLLDLPVGVSLGVAGVEDDSGTADILRDASLDALRLFLRLGLGCGRGVVIAVAVLAHILG